MVQVTRSTYWNALGFLVGGLYLEPRDISPLRCGPSPTQIQAPEYESSCRLESFVAPRSYPKVAYKAVSCEGKV